MDIPNNFYRLSAKALIINKGKFLLCHEEDGTWDFPGGAIEFGEKPEQTIIRELKEEMGAIVKRIDKQVKYVTTFKSKKDFWKASIFYEVEVENLEFKPSDECWEIKFFNKEEAKVINSVGIQEFLEIYDEK